MTTYNATVENGIATIQVDTTNMNTGEHSILANYNQNEHYNSSTANATLTIEPVEQWTYADISTTSTEWTGTPASDGIHATTSYIAYKTQMPVNTVLEITANITNDANIDIRDRITSNTSALAFKTTEIAKWGGVGSGVISNDKIPKGTDITIRITNTANGVFQYEYSDGTTGTVNLNSNLLDTHYVAFRGDNGGELIITELRYKSVQTGGGGGS